MGGVNVAFCSGNVRRVEANIDYGVWCRLMTPNDAGVNDPGALVPVPAGSTNNFGYLRDNAPLPSEYE